MPRKKRGTLFLGRCLFIPMNLPRKIHDQTNNKEETDTTQ